MNRHARTSPCIQTNALGVDGVHELHPAAPGAVVARRSSAGSMDPWQWSPDPAAWVGGSASGRWWRWWRKEEGMPEHWSCRGGRGCRRRGGRLGGRGQRKGELGARGTAATRDLVPREIRCLPERGSGEPWRRGAAPLAGDGGRWEEAVLGGRGWRGWRWWVSGGGGGGWPEAGGGA